MLNVETISRAIDPEAWDDARWTSTRADVEAMHTRRQRANVAALRVTEALAPTTARRPYIADEYHLAFPHSGAER